MYRMGFYEKYVKRILDVFLSILGILLSSWIYVILAVLVRIKLGSPILFKQPRPGKNEEIFMMYKFRTMTDECDEEGNILSDEKRLTKFGKWLRATSLDELPELFSIIKGDMSLIGPRPLLIRDMVFMSKQQRRRHTIRPGLSGLAQVNGRNDIDWEAKLNYDTEYIKHITFIGDCGIVFETLIKAFIQKDGISAEGMATAEDYGDYLLQLGKIEQEEYERKQCEAKHLVDDYMLLRKNG